MKKAKNDSKAKAPATKKAASKTRRPAQKEMSTEEVYALLMGPSGKHLFQLRQKTQKELDGLDIKNPSPEAVARAAKGLSEMLDTFINCITIRLLLANLEAAAQRLGSATPYEIVSIQLEIARAKAWLEANCKNTM